MTETTFTPGPWWLEFDDEGPYIRMPAAGGNDMSLMVYAAVDPDQREADANLIAAAPDLYAALEAVVKRDGKNIPEWRAAEAALAKARGEA